VGENADNEGMGESCYRTGLGVNAEEKWGLRGGEGAKGSKVAGGSRNRFRGKAGRYTEKPRGVKKFGLCNGRWKKWEDLWASRIGKSV